MPRSRPGPGRIRGQGGAERRRRSGDHARSRARELPQPRLLRSADGVLDVRLTAAPAVVDMGAPGLVKTYTWNKVVPGYTWEIRPGDP